MRPPIRPDVFVAACELGSGLFAGSPIAAGSEILPLTGPPFSRQDPIHDTPDGANLMQTGPRSYIMLQPPAVFANHSCDPNAGIKAGRSLVAIRDIPAGKEIRFDYSTTMDEGFWTMPCRCGHPACRGVVTDFVDLPLSVQRRYLDLGIVQEFIALRVGGRMAAGGA